MNISKEEQERQGNISIISKWDIAFEKLDKIIDLLAPKDKQLSVEVQLDSKRLIDEVEKRFNEVFFDKHEPLLEKQHTETQDKFMATVEGIIARTTVPEEDQENLTRQLLVLACDNYESFIDIFEMLNEYHRINRAITEKVLKGERLTSMQKGEHISALANLISRYSSRACSNNSHSNCDTL